MLWVVCLIGAAYTGWWMYDTYVTHPFVFMDLDAYSLGVHAWWHGDDMYGPLPPTRYGPTVAFVYPPFAAVVLSPLVALPWPVMTAVMVLISMACLAAVIHLTTRRVWPEGGRRGALLVTAVVLPLSTFTEPVYDTFLFGQINLLLLGLVAFDCLVEKPRWPRGALVGIAAAIKLTPAVFLLYFLFRKDFRASVAVVVSAAAATAVGLAANWSGSMAFFFGTTGPRTISATGFIGNQSIAGAFARWKLPETQQHQLWVYACVAAGVLALFALLRAYRTADPVLAMSVTAAFGLLISPVSWGHHWVFMVPAFIGMVAVGVRRRHVGWLSAAVVVGAVAVYPPYLLTEEGGYLMTVPQQLAANGFCVVGIVLLVFYAVPEITYRTRPAVRHAGNPADRG